MSRTITHIEDLQTGDIVLSSIPATASFVARDSSDSRKEWLSTLHGWWLVLYHWIHPPTDQNATRFAHVGVVVRNPTFVHALLRGIYVWHVIPSSTQTTTPVLEMLPIHEFVLQMQYRGGRVFVRPCILHGNNDRARNGYTPGFQASTLQRVHKETMENDFQGATSTTQWCNTVCESTQPSAAFVAWLYLQCGVLDPHRTRWSITCPDDFAQRTERLWYTHGVINLSDTTDTIHNTIDEDTDTLSTDNGGYYTTFVQVGRRLLGGEFPLQNLL